MSREFERIARIRRQLARRDFEVEVGIGDDAAVLRPTDTSQVLSVDAVVEGVHFERSFLSAADLGYRALMTAASDLAAMGASARASLLSIILPRDYDDDSLDGLVAGFGEAADITGAHCVGGNLSAGAQLSLTTTVLGVLAARPIRREGAQRGDELFVTGTVGTRALGLALLKAGRDVSSDPEAQAFVDAWRRPRARLHEGRRLHGVANALIDVSDGLLQDLGHQLLRERKRLLVVPRVVPGAEHRAGGGHGAHHDQPDQGDREDHLRERDRVASLAHGQGLVGC